MMQANHTAMQYEMQDKALKYYPQKIAETKLFIEALGKDLPVVQAHPVKDDAFPDLAKAFDMMVDSFKEAVNT